MRARGADSRAIFLDRDGTLTAERGFVTDRRDLELLPGTLPALRDLSRAGFDLVVATNQSGVARGLYDEAALAAVHERLHQMLERLPRAYLHCPHLPEAEGPYGGFCSCRKPADGLLLQARDLLGVVFRGSFAIGDSARDLLPAARLGLRTILVRTGKPWREQLARLEREGRRPDFVADDLAGAARWILKAPKAD
ncbi:MAG: HAD family hydrolase [Planctomycetota bacterium]